jgi:hypothetical protein
MDLQTRKYQLIEWITNIQDIKLLEKLHKMAESTDWWNDISDIEKKQIEKGLSDIQEGKTVYHTTAKKRYEKYL